MPLRIKQRTDVFTVEKTVHIVRAASVHNDHRDIVVHTDLSGVELCDHTARSELGTFASSERHNGVGKLRNSFYKLRILIRSRVAVVKTVDIREDHEKIGACDSRNDSRKRVVVAEFDLFGGYGVVFIDYGDHRKL